MLRHTFAIKYMKSRMKSKILQIILGHSNITMTINLYLHITEEEKEKEMKKFEEIYQVIQCIVKRIGNF